MTIDNFAKKEFKGLLEKHNHIGIFPSPTKGADAFSAGVAMYQILREKFEGNKSKQIDLVYKNPIPPECQTLINKDQITTNVAERKVEVTIDYKGTDAGKWTWHTENDKLIIKLGPVDSNFDLDRVRSKIKGFNYDLAICIGAAELSDLGTSYANLRQELNSARKINIDNSENNTKFGLINILDAHEETISNVLFKNLNELGLEINKRAAQALLIGMTYMDIEFKSRAKQVAK